jgi:hypothetical protein
LKHIKGYFHKKGRILLVREAFFPYFCRSTIKKKEYEYKTEKIYFTGRRNSKILVQHTGGHEKQADAATQSCDQGTLKTRRPLSYLCQGIVPPGTRHGKCMD